MSNPLIVAFSGLDGSGKTTQIKALKHIFESYGYRVKVLNQFSTKLGKLCKRIVKNSSNPYVRSISFALDNYIQCYNDKQSDYEYDLVLCDRSINCAIAYSCAQGVSRAWLTTLYEYSIPYDLCFYLDVSINTSLKRKGLDDKSPRFTREQYVKTREIYLELVTSNDLININAEKDFDEVTNDITIIILEALQNCN